MEAYQNNQFLFSSKYRLLRHIAFWIGQIIITSALWFNLVGSVWKDFLGCVMWVPVIILYCYPLLFWVYPEYLLKGKNVAFILIMITWAIAGWFLNAFFRAFIFIPIQQYMHTARLNTNPWQQGTFLGMNATAGVASVIVLFKYWLIKQRDLMQALQEKTSLELQLLKAQVQPNFLFHTLNNIYTFSIVNSPKTPGLILKLSSLLSYMLYDCKVEEVSLEKEIEVMKNYLELEKERFGNKIDISLNFEGDIKNQYIAPLLLLPFLENAFKHGLSELIEKPWLSIDVVVKHHVMRCKIVNSKADTVMAVTNGLGIESIKKRLELLYPGKHELKTNNEEDFFSVSLLIELIGSTSGGSFSNLLSIPVKGNIST